MQCQCDISIPNKSHRKGISTTFFFSFLIWLFTILGFGLTAPDGIMDRPKKCNYTKLMCNESRLLEEDKVIILNIANDIRNTVAGGNFKYLNLRHDPVSNMNKLSWNEELAEKAMSIVSHCPKTSPSFIGTETSIERKNGVDEIKIKSSLDPSVYKPKAEIPGCEVSTITYSVKMNLCTPQKIKERLIAYLIEGGLSAEGRKYDLRDFWITIQHGEPKLSFRRVESSQLGCGYMVRMGKTYYNSYLTCIHCFYNVTSPIIGHSGEECSQAFPNIDEKYEHLCSDTKNEYKLIAKDVPNVVCKEDLVTDDSTNETMSTSSLRKTTTANISKETATINKTITSGYSGENVTVSEESSIADTSRDSFTASSSQEIGFFSSSQMLAITTTEIPTITEEGFIPSTSSSMMPKNHVSTLFSNSSMPYTDISTSSLRISLNATKISEPIFFTCKTTDVRSRVKTISTAIITSTTPKTTATKLVAFYNTTVSSIKETYPTVIIDTSQTLRNVSSGSQIKSLKSRTSTISTLAKMTENTPITYTHIIDTNASASSATRFISSTIVDESTNIGFTTIPISQSSSMWMAITKSATPTTTSSNLKVTRTKIPTNYENDYSNSVTKTISESSMQTSELEQLNAYKTNLPQFPEGSFPHSSEITLSYDSSPIAFNSSVSSAHALSTKLDDISKKRTTKKFHYPFSKITFRKSTFKKTTVFKVTSEKVEVISPTACTVTLHINNVLNSTVEHETTPDFLPSTNQLVTSPESSAISYKTSSLNTSHQILSNTSTPQSLQTIKPVTFTTSCRTISKKTNYPQSGIVISSISQITPLVTPPTLHRLTTTSTYPSNATVTHSQIRTNSTTTISTTCRKTSRKIYDSTRNAINKSLYTRTNPTTISINYSKTILKTIHSSRSIAVTSPPTSPSTQTTSFIHQTTCRISSLRSHFFLNTTVMPSSTQDISSINIPDRTVKATIHLSNSEGTSLIIKPTQSSPPSLTPLHAQKTSLEPSKNYRKTSIAYPLNTTSTLQPSQITSQAFTATSFPFQTKPTLNSLASCRINSTTVHSLNITFISPLTQASTPRTTCRTTSFNIYYPPNITPTETSLSKIMETSHRMKVPKTYNILNTTVKYSPTKYITAPVTFYSIPLTISQTVWRKTMPNFHYSFNTKHMSPKTQKNLNSTITLLPIYTKENTTITSSILSTTLPSASLKQTITTSSSWTTPIIIIAPNVTAISMSRLVTHTIIPKVTPLLIQPNSSDIHSTTCRTTSPKAYYASDLIPTSLSSQIIQNVSTHNSKISTKRKNHLDTTTKSLPTIQLSTIRPYKSTEMPIVTQHVAFQFTTNRSYPLLFYTTCRITSRKTHCLSSPTITSLPSQTLLNISPLPLSTSTTLSPINSFRSTEMMMVIRNNTRTLLLAPTRASISSTTCKTFKLSPIIESTSSTQHKDTTSLSQTPSDISTTCRITSQKTYTSLNTSVVSLLPLTSPTIYITTCRTTLKPHYLSNISISSSTQIKTIVSQNMSTSLPSLNTSSVTSLVTPLPRRINYSKISTTSLKTLLFNTTFIPLSIFTVPPIKSFSNIKLSSTKFSSSIKSRIISPVIQTTSPMTTCRATSRKTYSLNTTNEAQFSSLQTKSASHPTTCRSTDLKYYYPINTNTTANYESQNIFMYSTTCRAATSKTHHISDPFITSSHRKSKSKSTSTIPFSASSCRTTKMTMMAQNVAFSSLPTLSKEVIISSFTSLLSKTNPNMVCTTCRTTFQKVLLNTINTSLSTQIVPSTKTTVTAQNFTFTSLPTSRTQHIISTLASLQTTTTCRTTFQKAHYSLNTTIMPISPLIISAQNITFTSVSTLRTAPITSTSTYITIKTNPSLVSTTCRTTSRKPYHSLNAEITSLSSQITTSTKMIGIEQNFTFISSPTIRDQHITSTFTSSPTKTNLSIVSTTCRTTFQKPHHSLNTTITSLPSRIIPSTKTTMMTQNITLPSVSTLRTAPITSISTYIPIKTNPSFVSTTCKTTSRKPYHSLNAEITPLSSQITPSTKTIGIEQNFTFISLPTISAQHTTSTFTSSSTKTNLSIISTTCRTTFRKPHPSLNTTITSLPSPTETTIMTQNITFPSVSTLRTAFITSTFTSLPTKTNLIIVSTTCRTTFQKPHHSLNTTITSLLSRIIPSTKTTMTQNITFPSVSTSRSVPITSTFTSLLTKTNLSITSTLTPLPTKTNLKILPTTCRTTSQNVHYFRNTTITSLPSLNYSLSTTITFLRSQNFTFPSLPTSRIPPITTVFTPLPAETNPSTVFTTCKKTSQRGVNTITTSSPPQIIPFLHSTTCRTTALMTHHLLNITITSPLSQTMQNSIYTDSSSICYRSTRMTTAVQNTTSSHLSAVTTPPITATVISSSSRINPYISSITSCRKPVTIISLLNTTLTYPQNKSTILVPIISSSMTNDSLNTRGNTLGISLPSQSIPSIDYTTCRTITAKINYLPLTQTTSPPSFGVSSVISTSSHITSPNIINTSLPIFNSLSTSTVTSMPTQTDTFGAFTTCRTTSSKAHYLFNTTLSFLSTKNDPLDTPIISCRTLHHLNSTSSLPKISPIANSRIMFATTQTTSPEPSVNQSATSLKGYNSINNTVTSLSCQTNSAEYSNPCRTTTQKQHYSQSTNSTFTAQPLIVSCRTTIFTSVAPDTIATSLSTLSPIQTARSITSTTFRSIPKTKINSFNITGSTKLDDSSHRTAKTISAEKFSITSTSHILTTLIRKDERKLNFSSFSPTSCRTTPVPILHTLHTTTMTIIPSTKLSKVFIPPNLKVLESSSCRTTTLDRSLNITSGTKPCISFTTSHSSTLNNDYTSSTETTPLVSVPTSIWTIFTTPAIISETTVSPIKNIYEETTRQPVLSFSLSPAVTTTNNTNMFATFISRGKTGVGSSSFHQSITPYRDPTMFSRVNSTSKMEKYFSMNTKSSTCRPRKILSNTPLKPHGTVTSNKTIKFTTDTTKPIVFQSSSLITNVTSFTLAYSQSANETKSTYQSFFTPTGRDHSVRRQKPCICINWYVIFLIFTVAFLFAWCLQCWQRVLLF